MAKTQSSNYTASNTDFQIPGADGDQFDRNDITKLGQALEEHTHASTRGLQIPTGGIADTAVTAAKLASDAVTTVKILDANVTAAKLASDAVTTVKILDSNVTTDKIADSAVTAAKIANRSRTVFLSVVQATGDNAPASHVANTCISYIALVDSAIQDVNWNWLVPSDWASGTISIEWWWTRTGGIGNVRLTCAVQVLAANDSYAESSSDETNNLAAGATYAVTKQTVHTGVTVVAGALLGIQLYRTGTHGDDTFNDAAMVLGISITYTADS